MCTDEEQKINNSKKEGNVEHMLMDQNLQKGWEEAVSTRSLLLLYGRNSEKLTVMIENRKDFFRDNSVWMSNA